MSSTVTPASAPYRPTLAESVDISIFKNFNFREQSRVQFRFEALNLVNTPSFAAPYAVLDTNNVGRVTATATAPRQMQIALKYYF